MIKDLVKLGLVFGAWLMAAVGGIGGMIYFGHTGLADPVGIPVAVAMIAFVLIANALVERL